MKPMINTEINGAVAHLIYDDGGLNIITADVLSKLLQTLQFLESNKDVKTLVIEGNGRSFSAGLDLSMMESGGEPMQAMLQEMGQFLFNLYSSRMRIVSLCAGHAAAAGAMLLLVSDYRVGVSRSGKIGFSEVANGISLNSFAIKLAEDRLNRSELFAATTLARMYDPDAAVRAGFLDVAMTNYRDAKYHAMQQAERLAQLDDEAYLQTLRAVRASTLDIQ
ncbi:MAG: enoyl-CoA hydratase [Patiriisocius sp.]|jgi:enoyl-CoA hydratase